MTFVTEPETDMIMLYDRLATNYDRLHRRWLRFSGGAAQAALEAAVRVAMTPSAQMLDAGCGTGRFTRRLLAEGVRPDQITLLDPSPAMLAHSADILVERSTGRLESLPFPDRSYDIVTCAWAIETLHDPKTGLRELCRVLRPGGMLCVTFCANKPVDGLVARVMRHRISRRGTGRFLDVGLVVDCLRDAIPCDVQVVPLAGPAATLILRRRPEKARHATQRQ